MMKDSSGELKMADWEDVILTVAKVLDSTPGDRMAGRRSQTITEQT